MIKEVLKSDKWQENWDLVREVCMQQVDDNQKYRGSQLLGESSPITPIPNQCAKAK